MEDKIIESIWERQSRGNFIMRRDGYCVSYNPDIQASVNISSFGFLNYLLDRDSISNIETALIIDNKYYILNGDWRTNYQELNTVKQALDFYSSKKKSGVAVGAMSNMLGDCNPLKLDEYLSRTHEKKIKVKPEMFDNLNLSIGIDISNLRKPEKCDCFWCEVDNY